MCIGFGRLDFVALDSDGVQHGLEAFEAQHSQLWVGSRLGRLLQAHPVLAAAAKIVFELRIPFRQFQDFGGRQRRLARREHQRMLKPGQIAGHGRGAEHERADNCSSG
ncbi:hypothetical protein [Ralstonia pickettii]|uniref:hypothetical protein n=1 Tax=Ralstonia pickettii TaxID=329 RepID=UPI0015C06CA2|nr:hypothetical protein [Ralstonia pickettii]NWK43638.1 hypothetical protein [Ralstonia pickettii]